MIDHLNAFLSMVNQLAAMKMMNDEMLASLLLCSLPNSQENFVVIISNFILNGALFIKLMKGNLHDEGTKRKASNTKNA